MAEPTKKSPAIEKFLNKMGGRTMAIRANQCVEPPIGCGGPAQAFDDSLSVREFRITGLCQKCQNALYGSGGPDG